MKKLIIPFVALFVVAVALVSWRSQTAKDPAVHINDFGCAVFDGNGVLTFVPASGNAVITSSGNSKITCKASDLPNSTGQAVKWNFDNTGLPCGTFSGLTDDWQNIVSASGQVTLQCRLHP